MNEEESRDRKQSGTEGKGRRIKMRREGICGEEKGGRREEGGRRGRNPGRLREAKILLSLPLERAEKKERSKVRASGPDTDRFSCDTDEEEEGAGKKEDKRIYLPVQARISASSKISGEQMVSTAFIRFTDPSRKNYLIIFLKCKSTKKNLVKVKNMP